MTTYFPLSAETVAGILGLANDEDISGESIAADMLSGKVEFTPDELKKLAAYSGVSVEYMTTRDPSFRRYADPLHYAAMLATAAALVRDGHDEDFAAEFCGLRVRDVYRMMEQG